MLQYFKSFLKVPGVYLTQSFKKNRHGLSSKLIYFGLVEEGIMLNVDGSLMASYWFRGYDLESSTAEEIARVLTTLGFTNQIEKINAVDAYFGALPGYSYENVRKSALHTLNLADLIPQTAIWAGRERNPCPYYSNNNPPLLYAKTTRAAPFRFNLHVEDKGHTLLLGPTRSGKSTLLGE